MKIVGHCKNTKISNNNTYYQRNKEKEENCYRQESGKEKANEYYENNKERLQGQVRNKYREMFNNEKNIKIEYEKKLYKSMSKGNKEKLRENEKSYCNTQIKCFIFLLCMV